MKYSSMDHIFHNIHVMMKGRYKHLQKHIMYFYATFHLPVVSVINATSDMISTNLVYSCQTLLGEVNFLSCRLGTIYCVTSHKILRELFKIFFEKECEIMSSNKNARLISTYNSYFNHFYHTGIL
jgi:hypothetical protein